MPFEIAPKELTVADKLAALIEAGRASNPGAPHIRGRLSNGEGVCAMGYAFLAAGITVEALADVFNTPWLDVIGLAIDSPIDDVYQLARRVARMNDDTEASVDEITVALRAGMLPEARGRITLDVMPIFYSKSFTWVCAATNSQWPKQSSPKSSTSKTRNSQ